MKRKERKRSKLGFVLIELIIVLGIFSVLGTVGVTKVAETKKNVDQKKLDDYAKTIYTAVQSKFEELSSTGHLDELKNTNDFPNGYTPSDFTPDGTKIFKAEQMKYLVVHPSGDAQTLIPTNVDPELYSKYWLIEYNKYSGAVYSVFYKETPFDSDVTPEKLDDYRGSLASRIGSGLGYAGGYYAEVNVTYGKLTPRISFEPNADKTQDGIAFRCTLPSGFTDPKGIKYRYTIEIPGRSTVIVYNDELSAALQNESNNFYMFIPFTDSKIKLKKGETIKVTLTAEGASKKTTSNIDIDQYVYNDSLADTHLNPEIKEISKDLQKATFDLVPPSPDFTEPIIFTYYIESTDKPGEKTGPYTRSAILENGHYHVEEDISGKLPTGAAFMMILDAEGTITPTTSTPDYEPFGLPQLQPKVKKVTSDLQKATFECKQPDNFTDEKIIYTYWIESVDKPGEKTGPYTCSAILKNGKYTTEVDLVGKLPGGTQFKIILEAEGTKTPTTCIPDEKEVNAPNLEPDVTVDPEGPEAKFELTPPGDDFTQPIKFFYYITPLDGGPQQGPFEIGPVEKKDGKYTTKVALDLTPGKNYKIELRAEGTKTPTTCTPDYETFTIAVKPKYNSGFYYFEVYNGYTGTNPEEKIGLYSYQGYVNTLKGSASNYVYDYTIGDGYGIIISASEAAVTAKVTDSVTMNGNATTFDIGAGKNYTAGKIIDLEDGSKLYCFPTTLMNPLNGGKVDVADGNLYSKVTIDYSGSKADEAYYYTSYFAKAIYASNDSDATKSKPTAKSVIEIRSPRQLFGLSHMYGKVKNFLLGADTVSWKNVRFDQTLDIDYAEYYWNEYTNLGTTKDAYYSFAWSSYSSVYKNKTDLSNKYGGQFPIGPDFYHFESDYNGYNHYIKNIKLQGLKSNKTNDGVAEYTLGGLFGYTEGNPGTATHLKSNFGYYAVEYQNANYVEIKNVFVKNTTGTNNVLKDVTKAGGFVGWAYSFTKIENCGIEGYEINLDRSVTDKDSFDSTGCTDITKSAEIGGFVGYMHSDVEITNCYADTKIIVKGNPTKKYNIGGFVAFMHACSNGYSPYEGSTPATTWSHQAPAEIKNCNAVLAFGTNATSNYSNMMVCGFVANVNQFENAGLTSCYAKMTKASGYTSSSFYDSYYIKKFWNCGYDKNYEIVGTASAPCNFHPTSWVKGVYFNKGINGCYYTNDTIGKTNGTNSYSKVREAGSTASMPTVLSGFPGLTR